MFNCSLCEIVVMCGFIDVVGEFELLVLGVLLMVCFLCDNG